MHSLFTIILILLCGVWDRKRGDDELGLSNKFLDSLVYGVLIAALATNFSSWQVSVFIALSVPLSIAVSYKNGWGAVTGLRDLEPGRGWSWWERSLGKLFPITLKNKHTNLFIRSLLAGLIMVPSCHYAGIYTPIIGAAIGFNLAPYLSITLMRKDKVPGSLDRWNILKPGKERWNLAEFCRGTIFGLISSL